MNDNKIANNVVDVVDEILGIKEDKPQETISIKETIIEEQTPPPPIPVGNKSTNTPPPIPTQKVVAEDTPPPPPIPAKKFVDDSNDDFLKQVMDVVNNDIDVKPIDLSGIKEALEDDEPIVEHPKVIPSTPIAQPKPVAKEESIVYMPREDGKFLRTDNIKPESYNHNLRIERPNYFEIERIQRELDNKHIDLINEKYKNIIDVKDNNIEALMNQSDDLIKEIENEKLTYSKQIEEIYKKENEELKEIKEKLESLLNEKEKLEKVVYDYQLKELEEIQKKAMEERLKLEQERLLQEELRRQEYERELQRLKWEEVARQQQELSQQQKSNKSQISMKQPQPSMRSSFTSRPLGNRGPSAMMHRPSNTKVVSLRDAANKNR